MDGVISLCLVEGLDDRAVHVVAAIDPSVQAQTRDACQSEATGQPT